MSGNNPPIHIIEPEIQDPELPPPGFDPLNNKSDRQRLEAFSLPPRPDPLAERELYAHWKALFSGGPLTYVKANSTLDHVSTDRVDHEPHDKSRPPGRGANAEETSRNWSGAYVTAGRGDSLVQVGAAWTVPVPMIGFGPNPNHLRHRCSIWVGIDGRAHWARSMPQIGTEHTIDPKTNERSHRFWWQWWLGDRRESLPYTIGIGLNPGDRIICQLRMESDRLAIFHAKNDTTHTLTSIRVTGLAPIVGNSAEWIVEQPSRPCRDHGVLQQGDRYPSPDFGRVDFTGLVARGVSPTCLSRTYTMRSARLITGFEVWPDPTRVVVIGRPERAPAEQNGLFIAYAGARSGHRTNV